MRSPALDFTGLHWQGSNPKSLTIEDFQVRCSSGLGGWVVTNQAGFFVIRTPEGWQHFLAWMVE